jgi:hypothetical protein
MVGRDEYFGAATERIGGVVVVSLSGELDQRSSVGTGG